MKISSRAALAVTAYFSVGMSLVACGDDVVHGPVLDVAAVIDVVVADSPLAETADDAAVCATADDCDPSAEACRVAACQEGQCSIVDVDDGAECDDGDSCTGPDTCTAATCAGPFTCECKKIGDCASKNDDNPCTANYLCDLFANVCKLNPASGVQCLDEVAGVCVSWGCDPADGKCRIQPDDSLKCTDDSPCALEVGCQGGQCVITKNACSCATDADCAASASGTDDQPGPDDANLCNGVYFCNKTAGVCELNPGSVVACPEFNKTDCFAEVCQPNTGKCAPTNLQPGPSPVNLPNTASQDVSTCDTDGTHCSQEQCKGGKCSFIKNLDPCGCDSDSDCGVLEDGDVCNGTMYCSKATKHCQINPSTLVSCPTVADGPCAKTQCDKTSGKCSLKSAAMGSACVDGSPCTALAKCDKDGACKLAQSKCACTSNKDCAAFDNAIVDKCVGTQLYCDKLIGACALNPASRPVCKVTDDTACLQTRCEPKTGKCKPQATKDGTPCEADGTLCTAPDQCQKGQCQEGENLCKCGSNKDCAPFEDNDPCTGTLFCDKSGGELSTWRCKVSPKTAVLCPAGASECAPQVCDPADGKCKVDLQPDTHPCEEDGSKCSVEQCVAGKCVVKTNLCQCPKGDDCDTFEDGNPCNGTLFCDKSGEKADWACKVNPSSVVLCKPSSGSLCQREVCDTADGACKVEVFNDNNPCFDDDACTLAELCTKGECLQVPGGVTLTCNDANACTVDSCDKGKGCLFFAAAGAACTDGDACTENDKCGVGGDGVHACIAGQLQGCDDNEQCTDDACDKAKGCVYTGRAGACNDGDACTLSDACDGGKCVGANGAAGKLECKDDGDCKAVGCDPNVGCTFKGAAVEVCDGKVNVCGGELDAGCDDDGDLHCDAGMGMAAGATCVNSLDPAKTGCSLAMVPTVDFSKGGRVLKLSNSAISQDVPMVVWHGGRDELWQVRPLRHAQSVASVRRFDKAANPLGIFSTGRRQIRQVAADPTQDRWYATVAANGVTDRGLLAFAGATGNLAWLAKPIDSKGKEVALDAVAVHGGVVLAAPAAGGPNVVRRFERATGKDAGSVQIAHPTASAAVSWMASAHGELLVGHAHNENNPQKSVLRRFSVSAIAATVVGSAWTAPYSLQRAPTALGHELCLSHAFSHTCFVIAAANCSKGDDCNDSEGSVAPGVSEACDLVDNDCDGVADNGCDVDKDGYCAKGKVVTAPAACAKQSGKVGTDCVDGDSASHPGAPEVCDRIDNDCDGNTDKGCDVDGDGHCGKTMKVLDTAQCAKSLASDLSACGASKLREDDVWVARTLNLQAKSAYGAKSTVVALPYSEELWAIAYSADQGSPGWRYAYDGARLAAITVPLPRVTAMAGHLTKPLVLVATEQDGLNTLSLTEGKTQWTTKGIADRNHCMTAVYDGDDIWATFAASATLRKYDLDGKEVASAAIAALTPNANHQVAAVVKGKLFWSDGSQLLRLDLSTGKTELTLPLSGKFNTAMLVGAQRRELCGWATGNALSCFNVLRPDCSTAGDDCDDNSLIRVPSKKEICNGQDDDCDTKIDEDCDRDDDGFCAAGYAMESGAQCKAGKAGATVGDDCLDGTAAVYWGVKETCDAQDNNCDGVVDDGCDDDKDGFCDKNYSVTAASACPKTFGAASKCSAVSPLPKFANAKTWKLQHSGKPGAAGWHSGRSEWWIVVGVAQTTTPDQHYIYAEDGSLKSQHNGAWSGIWASAPAADHVYVRGHDDVLRRYDGVPGTLAWTKSGYIGTPAPTADGVWVKEKSGAGVQHFSAKGDSDGNFQLKSPFTGVSALQVVGDNLIASLGEGKGFAALNFQGGTEGITYPSLASGLIEFTTKGRAICVNDQLTGNVKCADIIEPNCQGGGDDCDGKVDNGCDADGDGYCGADKTVRTNHACPKTMGIYCQHAWTSSAVAEGKCFFLDVSAQRNFSDGGVAADSKCKGLGGRLASIESPGQNEAALEATLNAPAVAKAAGRPTPTSKPFIGLNDLGTDGTYKWLQGAKFDYENFKADGKKAGKGLVRFDSATGEWEEAPSAFTNFLCRVDQVLDCDDTTTQTGPAAVEICDGKDNNCDGAIDEGCDDDNDTFCDSAKVVLPGAKCSGTVGANSACKGALPVENAAKTTRKLDPAVANGLLYYHSFLAQWWLVDGATIHTYDDLGTTKLGAFNNANLDSKNLAFAHDRDEYYGAGKGSTFVAGKAAKWVGLDATVVWQSAASYFGVPAVADKHLWVIVNKDKRLLSALGRSDGKVAAAMQLTSSSVEPWGLVVFGDLLFVGRRNIQRVHRFEIALGANAGDTKKVAEQAVFDIQLRTAGGQIPWAYFRRGYELCATGTKHSSESACYEVAKRSCHTGGDDCDDSNSGVKPGVETVCDGKDQSCDGVIDNGCDADGDGYCATSKTVEAGALCSNDKPGKGTDCNDQDADAFAGGPEVCDGTDSNCNGSKDEGCDDDGDGFCDAALKVTAGASCSKTLSALGRCGDLVTSAMDTSTQAKTDTFKFKVDLFAHDGVGGGHTFLNEYWLVYDSGKQVARYSPHADASGGVAWLGSFPLTAASPLNGTNVVALAGDPRENRWVACRAGSLGMVRYDGLATTTISASHAGPCLAVSATGDRYYTLDPDAATLHTHDRRTLARHASVKMALGSLQSVGYYNGSYIAQRGTDAYRFDATGAQVAKLNLHPTTTSPRFFAMPHIVFSDSAAQGKNGTFRRYNIFKADGLNGFYAAPDCSKGGDDCDDNNYFVKPVADTRCDGQDNDCDGLVDELCDLDGDGYCAANMSVLSTAICSKDSTGKPGGDCDDYDATVFKSAVEVCNGVDDNCDKSVDEGCDEDGDGICAAGKQVLSGAKCKVGQSACRTYKALDTAGAKETRNPTGVPGFGTFHPYLNENWVVRDATVVPTTIVRSAPSSTASKPHIYGTLAVDAIDIQGAYGDLDTDDWYLHNGTVVVRLKLNGTEVWRTGALPIVHKQNPSVDGDWVYLTSKNDPSELLRIGRKDGKIAAPLKITDAKGGGFAGHSLVHAGRAFLRGKDAKFYRYKLNGAYDNFVMGVVWNDRPFAAGGYFCENPGSFGNVMCVPLFEPSCTVGQDCKDDDPKVFPQAVEVCNGKDDDCDGVTDECSDGDGCTVDVCKAGSCDSKTPLTCPAGDSCQSTVCNAKLGCVYSPKSDGTACEDGNPCTSTEACSGGICGAGAPLNGDEKCGGSGKCQQGDCNCGAGAYIDGDKCVACSVTCGVGASVDGSDYTGTGKALSLADVAAFKSGKTHLLGTSLAGDGALLASGAPNAPAGANRGAVQVFERQVGGAFTTTEHITRAGGSDGDLFGWGLAAQGQELLVGSPGANNGGSGRGRVDLLARDGNKVWQLGSGPQPTSWGNAQKFGQAVAWVGDQAVVGAPGDDAGGADRGSVFVFTRKPNKSWEQQARLQPANSKPGDQLGEAAATSFDGEQIALGAVRGDPNKSDLNGHVWVYRKLQGVWTLSADFAPPPEIAASVDATDKKARFGRAVAIDGNRLLVAATGDSSKKKLGGSIALFRRDGAGKWDYKARIFPQRSEVGDTFPSALAIRGDRLLVGCNGCEQPSKSGDNHGRGFMFVFDGTTYSEAKELSANPQTYYELYGASVGFAGDDAFVGASYTDNPANSTADDRVGGVYHFKLAPPSCEGADTCLCSSGYEGKLCDKQSALQPPSSCPSGQFVDAQRGACSVCALDCGAGAKLDTAPLVQELQPLPLLDNDYKTGSGHGLGTTLSAAGSVVVSGASAFRNQQYTGAVQVWERQVDGALKPTVLLKPTTTNVGQYFGAAAVTNGTIIAVSAPGFPDGTATKKDDKGKVFVYERASETSWQEVTGPTPDFTLKTGDRWGTSVSLDGDRMSVLCGSCDQLQTDVGGVWMFDRQPDKSWKQTGALMGSDAKKSEGFGRWQSVSGDWVAVTASGHKIGGRSHGAAYLFHYQGGKWTQTQKLVATMDSAHKTSSDNHANFSSYLTMKGDKLLVGCPGDGRKNYRSGAVMYFQRNSANQWQFKSTIFRPSPVKTDEFGNGGLALSGKKLLIGCHACDDAIGLENPSEGYTFLFKLSGTVWNAAQELRWSPNKDGNYAGASVAFAGSDALVGAYNFDHPLHPTSATNANTNTGAVLRWAGKSLCSAADQCVCEAGFTGKTCDLPVAPASCPGGQYVNSTTNNCDPCGCGGGTFTDPTKFVASRLTHPGSILDGDDLGTSVSGDGDWLVGGAPYVNSGTGKEYGAVVLYKKNSAGAFKSSAFFANPESTQTARMGTSVALSGSLLVAGAPTKLVAGSGDAGRVYVYENQNGTWKHVQSQSPAGLTPGAHFGDAVSVSQQWYAVGAPGANVNSKTSGAVFVAEWNGTQFGTPVRLEGPPELDTNALFGSGVSLHNTRLAVAAKGLKVGSDADRGGAWIYERVGGKWARASGLLQRAVDAAGGCGAVSLDGDRFLLGCFDYTNAGTSVGAGLVFERDTNGQWNLQAQLPFHTNAKLNDQAGRSVALKGDLAVLGVPGYDGAGTDVGAVAVYGLQSGNWALKKLVVPGDVQSGDQRFGHSVALVERTVVVGYPQDNGAQTNNGAVFTMTSPAGACDASGQCPCAPDWTGRTCETYQRDLCSAGEKPTASGCATCACSDGAAVDPFSFNSPQSIKPTGLNTNDMFGSQIAVDGDLALLGAPQGGSLVGSYRAGQVYGMKRDAAGNWALEDVVIQSENPGKQGFYGWSLAIDGARAVVGSRDSSWLKDREGEGYVLEREGSKWVQKALLRHSDTSVDPVDQLGDSAAIAGAWIALGAYGRDDGKSNQGAVYVFGRTANGKWNQTQKLQPDSLTDGDIFGRSATLAMAGADLFAGAPKFTSSGVKDAGQVFYYRRGGNRYNLVQALAPTTTSARQFSRPVVDGNTLMIGAHDELVSGKKEGGVHVYVRTGATWAFKHLITLGPTVLKGPVNNLGAQLGFSIAIDGELAAVGAPQDSTLHEQAGSVHLFRRQSNQTWKWLRTVRYDDMKNADDAAGTAEDRFGTAVALADRALFVGGNRLDEKGKISGGVLVYHGGRTCNGAGVCSCKAAKAGKLCDLDACAADKDCDDGNVCTVDSCGAESGCTYVAAVDGSGCSDGEACTSESCQSGACTNSAASADGTKCGGSGQCASSVCGCSAGDRIDEAGTCSPCGCGAGAVSDPADLVVDGLPAPTSLPDGAWEIGYSVAGTADTLVAGAPAWDDGKTKGAAFVWARQSDGSFKQVQTLSAFGATAKSPRFGDGVAVSGTWLAVAASGDDTAATNAGSVQLYQRKPWGHWSWLKAVAPAALNKDDRFGASVSLSDDYLVVGAPGHDAGGIVNSGAVWVYARGNDDWQTAVRLSPTGLGAGDAFGGELDGVDVDGSRIAAAAPGYDRAVSSGKDDGAVYLFERDNSGWKQVQQLVAADEVGKDLPSQSGSSHQLCGAVDLSGGRLVVGCSGDGQHVSGALNVGSAYFYQRDAGGQFKFQAKVISAGPNVTNLQFARRVEIDGNRALLHCPTCTGKQGRSGTAELWIVDGATWSRAGSLSPNDAPTDAKVGAGIALVGQEIVLGTSAHNAWGTKRPGSVSVVRAAAKCSAGGSCSCADGWSGYKCDVRE